MPLRELLESAHDLPRDRPVLLISRSGRRGARALYVLESLGYEKLAGVRGGILAWRAAGLPVETSKVEDGE
jgi:rhodanese-related sulfurtransferase